jgi:hypothetical protein
MPTAKSKYSEKRKRGLVPARYPDRMKGAWQHWPPTVTTGHGMAKAGAHDITFPREVGHRFVIPHKPITQGANS